MLPVWLPSCIYVQHGTFQCFLGGIVAFLIMMGFVGLPGIPRGLDSAVRFAFLVGAIIILFIGLNDIANCM